MNTSIMLLVIEGRFAKLHTIPLPAPQWGFAFFSDCLGWTRWWMLLLEKPGYTVCQTEPQVMKSMTFPYFFTVPSSFCPASSRPLASDVCLAALLTFYSQ